MKPGDGGPADRINCRCALVNVLDGFTPNANLRRDNVTGKSIPYMTYSEWEAANGVTNYRERNTRHRQHTDNAL